MSKTKIAILTVFFLLALSAIGYALSQSASHPVQSVGITSAAPTLMPSPLPTAVAPPAMEIDPAKTYQATLHTTVGDITIQFDTKNTPITSNNFIHLARSGFYDHTVFHRVIKGFMIQGGDPKGDGTGGPGYQFADEYLGGDYTRGAVAMANSGPNTNGSQFFIMQQDYALPHAYVVFAHVTSGLDVVDAIASAPVTANAFGENSKPLTPVSVTSISVTTK